MKTQIETERKFIIKMPDISILEKMEGYTRDAIIQIYLPSAVGGTHRVRSRSSNGRTVYTETEKIRISSASSIEREGEISEARFAELSKNILEGTRPIKKTRHSFSFRGQVFEIDVYPEWERCAVMEAELEDATAPLDIPNEISVISEVTGKKEYSNASMSRLFPPEIDYL